MSLAPLRPALPALALAALLAAPAWAQQTTPATDAAAEPAAEATADVDLAAVVATVDGVDVTMGEIILMRANLPAQYQALPDDQLYSALVNQAVTQILLADKGRDAGYAETELARLRALVDARNYLAEAYVQEVVIAATTEEKLRARYEEAFAKADPVPEIRASHILVSEKELADEIHAELAEGADFAELAKEHGTDGTKASGGDLGWFTRERMVPEFSEAAFAAEEGVPTEPVQTSFGWHLILVTGKRDQPVPAFEAVREELAEAAAREAAQAEMTSLQNAAEIVYPETPPAAAGIRRDDLLLPE